MQHLDVNVLTMHTAHLLNVTLTVLTFEVR